MRGDSVRWAKEGFGPRVVAGGREAGTVLRVRVDFGLDDWKAAFEALYPPDLCTVKVQSSERGRKKS